MLFVNKKRIAYLSALTLLFSYAELLIPRFVPFFRLGLGNIAILVSFSLNPLDFLLLTVIKAVASSLVAGTLFSPFFVISLAQSVVSGFVMYCIAKVFHGRLISVYGISMTGSACSALIQILLSSLYLGQGTMALLGPMLLFSLFSGLVTAWLSVVLHIPQETPELVGNASHKNNTLNQGDDSPGPQGKGRAITAVLLLLLASLFIFTIHNLYVLAGAFVVCVIAQICTGRRFKIIPHLSLWLFVIISTLLVPQGQILCSIWKWNITQGALLRGMEKCLKLSAVSALSQCAASIRLQGNGIVALALAYFRGLSKIMNESQGKLIHRVRTALSAESICE